MRMYSKKKVGGGEFGDILCVASLGCMANDKTFSVVFSRCKKVTIVRLFILERLKKSKWFIDTHSICA